MAAELLAAFVKRGTAGRVQNGCKAILRRSHLGSLGLCGTTGRPCIFLVQALSSRASSTSHALFNLIIKAPPRLCEANNACHGAQLYPCTRGLTPLLNLSGTSYLQVAVALAAVQTYWAGCCRAELRCNANPSSIRQRELHLSRSVVPFSEHQALASFDGWRPLRPPVSSVCLGVSQNS